MALRQNDYDALFKIDVEALIRADGKNRLDHFVKLGYANAIVRDPVVTFTQFVGSIQAGSGLALRSNIK